MITKELAEKYGWEYLRIDGSQMDFRKAGAAEKYALLSIINDVVRGNIVCMDNPDCGYMGYSFTGEVRDETQFAMVMEMLKLK